MTNRDAINILEEVKILDDTMYAYNPSYLEALDMALTALEAEETWYATHEYPPKTRWIPVSERLPEEHEWMGTKRFGTTISDEVYVTFENPKGERFCKHLSFQNGKLSGFDQLEIDAFYKGSKPIAWKPLPEPYRGEQE